MTFPKRPDAYVATDLLHAMPSEDQVPSGPPPAIPYPSLAPAPPPHSHSNRLNGLNNLGLGSGSVRSASSRTAGGAGGFFASIGRKTSTKRDRTADAPPNKLISKRSLAAASSSSSAHAPEPRAIHINATPSLPGGPRAPPGRVQRAQSVIAPMSTGAAASSSADSDQEVVRRASTHRSPSVAPTMARSATVPQRTADTQEFQKQLSHLVDLLPGADRDILSGYLERAGGQEMVAIGRYLDDQSNNVIQ